VHDQVAVATIDEQILAAPEDRSDGAPGEPAHRGRHRPAQARLADLDPRDDATANVRQKSSPRDLDFR